MSNPKAKTTCEQDPKGEAAKLKSSERMHALALRRYGQAIFAAATVYEDELARLAGTKDFAGISVADAMHYGKEYKLTQSIIGFLGMAFQHAAGERFEMQGDDRRTIARLGSALRPHVDARSSGEAVELAEHIVVEYAVMHSGGLNGWSGRDIARHLALSLTWKVHDAFFSLRDRADEIEALLVRYIPSSPRGQRGRAPRKLKPGEPKPLTPAGILCELNKLPRDAQNRPLYPLGRGLNPNGVDRAIRRYRVQML